MWYFLYQLMGFAMSGCIFLLLDKRIVIALFLFVCTGLSEIAPASGVRTSEVVSSREAAGSYSKFGQQGGPAGEVIFSTREAGSNERRLKRPAYRSTRSTDVSRPVFDPSRLPADYCAVVEHIAPLMPNPVNGGNTDAFISGTTAIPLGRSGGNFYTEIVVPANSGYTPPERNIAEPVYYRISLLANDGNRYLINQQFPPAFKPGETVRFNANGFPEKADCVMRQPDPFHPGQ